MRKYILYTVGIAIMALGVAISSFHGLGASPFDSLNFNVASITNLEIATTMLIFNAIFVLLFFIIHRNKDIYLSIICLFAFSFLVDTFIKLLSYIFIIDDLWFRIIQFILGFTLTAIGIAFVEESTLSRTPFECFVAVMDKIVFPKLDYAKSRIKTYIGRFTKLYSQIKKNEIDENFLKDIQIKDCIFPDIDYHIYTKL
jgi:uncharacterized membrane protein YczE